MATDVRTFTRRAAVGAGLGASIWLWAGCQDAVAPGSDAVAPGSRTACADGAASTVGITAGPSLIPVGDSVELQAMVDGNPNNHQTRWTSRAPQIVAIEAATGMTRARSPGEAWLIACAGSSRDSVRMTSLSRVAVGAASHEMVDVTTDMDAWYRLTNDGRVFIVPVGADTTRIASVWANGTLTPLPNCPRPRSVRRSGLAVCGSTLDGSQLTVSYLPSGAAIPDTIRLTVDGTYRPSVAVNDSLDVAVASSSGSSTGGLEWFAHDGAHRVVAAFGYGLQFANTGKMLVPLSGGLYQNGVWIWDPRAGDPSFVCCYRNGVTMILNEVGEIAESYSTYPVISPGVARWGDSVYSGIAVSDLDDRGRVIGALLPFGEPFVWNGHFTLVSALLSAPAHLDAVLGIGDDGAILGRILQNGAPRIVILRPLNPPW